MAKGKKKESLTPEERLQAALVPESEQPYPVPANWCWVRLGSLLSEIKNGTTIKQDKSGIGFKVTRIESLQNQTIDFGRLGTIVNAQEIKDIDWYLAGDIALSHINSAEHVGKTALINADMLPLVHGMNLLRLRFYSECCMPLFFQYFSQSFQYKDEILTRINMAVNQVSINQKQISSLEIPLPPVCEQQRIVDRIESLFAKLDEAKQKAQDALDSFETRKAAILHKAFTGELTAQWRKEHGVGMESWNSKPLSRVTENHDSERIPLSQAERSKLARVYDYYGASGVIDKVDRFLFEGRKLLIGEDGANLVTRSKPIAFIAEGQYWVNNHAHVLSVTSEMLLDFLCHYINSIDLTPYVTGSAQPKMTQAKMNTIPVPVPTVDEQTEIVRILDDLLAKEQQAKEAAEGVLEQIDLMKKAILARAFRGELGTNDPREESAVELLKQISSCLPG